MKPFTLLEMVISIAVLSLAAAAIGWEMKDVLTTHHFRSNIDRLLLDLKKAQIVALANRADIELRLQKIGKDYSYQFYSDEPLPAFLKKPMKLKGIDKMQKEDKPVEDHTLIIYSSGRIVSSGEISFFQHGGEGVHFNFHKAPQIELKEGKPL